VKATAATARRNELRAFLVARRAAVTPQSAGLAAGIRRRTPGLRREEVAALAGVGVTWYTWLEQGRDIRVSPQTLTRIADALRLSPTDTSYLFSLAGLPHERLSSRDGDDIQVARALQAAVDAFQAPAFVVSYCWDVLTFNLLADRIYRFAGCSGPFAQNHVWRLFMDPTRRAIYADWEPFAEFSVGIVRMAYADYRSDPRFNDLLQALRENSPDFKRLWDTQQTQLLIHRPVHLLAPGFGELHVTSLRFHSFGDDRTLILLPPADAATERLLARMARGRKRRRVGRASAR
jgi:transcriptional regulator with XRE-family HTH domain